MILIWGILLAICGSSFADLDVMYTLSTKEGHFTNFTRDNFTEVKFDPDSQYKIICHGWLSHHEWYPNFIKAYLKKNNTAVITIDYFEALSDYLYVGSVANVPVLGERVGRMLSNLSLIKKIPGKHFHLIGHSLGGQIAGVAGEFYRKNNDCRVGRITGLDPAFPGFYNPFSTYADHHKLSKEDADYVDVIHATFLSIPIAIGDSDFYINSGSYQTECSQITNGLRLECGHTIPIILFILSINGFNFEATECADYDTFNSGGCINERVVFMGDSIDLNTKGVFYLHVNANVLKFYDEL